MVRIGAIHVLNYGREGIGKWDILCGMALEFSGRSAGHGRRTERTHHYALAFALSITF
jgi:hypothetical protein